MDSLFAFLPRKLLRIIFVTLFCFEIREKSENTRADGQKPKAQEEGDSFTYILKIKIYDIHS